MRSAWRATKNFTFGYSGIQAKLREATSVEPTGPSTGQLQELASATHHASMLADMVVIFDKRLNDHGKYWRHVYKTLVVLEYCVILGSEAMVHYAKENIYIIKTLKEFIYVDDSGRDKGVLVREKSKDLVALLSDDDKLEEARRTGIVPNLERSNSIDPITVEAKDRKRIGDEEGGGRRRSLDEFQNMDEDEAMRIALEASKRDSRPGSKYQSFERDLSSSGSDDDDRRNISYQPHNYGNFDPFAQMSHNSPQMLMMQSNPFTETMALPPIVSNTPLMIESNPFAPMALPQPLMNTPQLPISNRPLEIEYNVSSLDRYEMQKQTNEPFIPLPHPQGFAPIPDNNIAAKPVGPHLAAPQFTYSNISAAPNNSSLGDIQDPFAMGAEEPSINGHLQK